MTEYEYFCWVEELKRVIANLEEENEKLKTEYASLERYCEKLEQGYV